MIPLLKPVIDILYPPVCTVCKTALAGTGHTGPLCGACRALIPFNRLPQCTRCARPLTGDRQGFCSTCVHHTAAYTQVWAVCSYSGVIRAALGAFKYHHRQSLGAFFAELMALFALRHLPRIDLVVPVPISAHCRHQRGFNQTEAIAIPFARRCRVPYDTRLLMKIRETPAQHLLNRKNRMTNLRGSFHAAAPERCRGRSVLVIDDVFTTGATAEECARTLRAAGPRALYVLTLARGTDEKNGTIPSCELSGTM